MPLGFFVGGLASCPGIHGQYLQVMSGWALGSHATVEYVCILDFILTLIVEINVLVLLKS